MEAVTDLISLGSKITSRMASTDPRQLCGLVQDGGLWALREELCVAGRGLHRADRRHPAAHATAAGTSCLSGQGLGPGHRGCQLRLQAGSARGASMGHMECVQYLLGLGSAVVGCLKEADA